MVNNIIHDIVFKRYLINFNLSEAYKFFTSRVIINILVFTQVFLPRRGKENKLLPCYLSF